MCLASALDIEASASASKKIVGPRAASFSALLILDSASALAPFLAGLA